MQRISSVFLCIFALLMGYAVQGMTGEIKQDKEFPLSKEAVVAAYNDTMQKFANFRPLDPAKEQRGNAKYADIRSYVLTPNVAVMFQMNKGGTNPTHVKAVGVEDGTEETRALIVLNCMTLLSAVTPTWKGDDRGAIAKALGITGTFPAVGKSESITAVEGNQQLKLTFANNGEYGLTFTIQPE